VAIPETPPEIPPLIPPETLPVIPPESHAKSQVGITGGIQYDTKICLYMAILCLFYYHFDIKNDLI
jgi:hypothetical protein